ncbi:MAG: rod shape-determining protein MreD [Nitrospirota bacterium]|nr:MAG: rod shape-determining protein MreD [Nitrospirota bacterium]
MKLFKRNYLNRKGFPEIPRMRRWQAVLAWTLVVIALLVIKTNISFFGVRLNLTVLVPFYIGLKRSPEKGLAVGIIIGLVEDSLSNTIIGPNILSKGSIGLLSSLLLGRFFIWTPLLGVLACFTATFIDGLIVFLSRELFFDDVGLLKQAVLIMLAQAFINSPVGYFIRPKDEQ